MRFQTTFTRTLALLTASLGWATSSANETSLLPYFQVTGSAEESSQMLPLQSTHAEVSIAGPLAEVTLTQTFTNEGAVPLDANYLFPASTGAAVHGMTMTLGDRSITAEIQEKEEAKKTFRESPKRKQVGRLVRATASQSFPNVGGPYSAR